MAVNRLNRCRSFVIVAALSILLQGQLVRPNPTGHQVGVQQIELSALKKVHSKFLNENPLFCYVISIAG